MNKTLEIGRKYGHLTVLEEAPRGKHGERRFICRCDCGFIGNFNAYPILKSQNKHCKKCVPHSGGLPKPDLVGQKINGWEVLAEEVNVNHRDKKGPYYFRCRCLRCGNESVHTAGQLYNSKSDRCQKCGPQYNFKICGNTAYGILPCGVQFIVDTEDIARVNQHFWRLESKDGYLVTKDKLRLHRYILGISDEEIIVDHINRNRLDCRKANLRVVSFLQNTMNHSKLSSNKTGYIGVYFSNHDKRYEVKVGYNRKRIRLGSSPNDMILLAGMYNVAARYLFGDYVGELNDVPDPPPSAISCVIEKCQKYKEAPAAKADAFSLEEAI